ncbi:MAG: hypothetical protein WA924_09790 [Burkholderiaceae bacterium]
MPDNTSATGAPSSFPSMKRLPLTRSSRGSFICAISRSASWPKAAMMPMRGVHSERQAGRVSLLLALMQPVSRNDRVAKRRGSRNLRIWTHRGKSWKEGQQAGIGCALSAAYSEVGHKYL